MNLVGVSVSESESNSMPHITALISRAVFESGFESKASFTRLRHPLRTESPCAISSVKSDKAHEMVSSSARAWMPPAASDWDLKSLLLISIRFQYSK